MDKATRLGVFLLILFMHSPFDVNAQGVFKDALGREVVLKDRPIRIVSFAPSITEILYFLEVQDRIVGVTEYSYYPPEANSKPKIGSYISINMEKVLSLGPDLVIATKDGNPPHVVDALDAAHIPVYVINPRSLDEIVITIKKISEVVGPLKEVESKIVKLTERIQKIKSLPKPNPVPKVFLQINLKPVMTVGKHTLHQDIISVAGGKNIFEDSLTPYPRISVEEVIRRSPDVIFISSMERRGEFEAARKEWMKWDSIPAVKSKRIFMVDSDLIDRPTPRAVDGLEYIYRMLMLEGKRDYGN